MNPEARELYDELRQQLIGVHANWEIFKQLFAHSDERMALMRRTAPGFFRRIQDALVDNAIISLSRMTDPARYNSLAGLVKLLTNDLNHRFLAELETDLTEIAAKCEAVRIHRNRRVAHNVRVGTAPELPEGIEQLPPISRADIEGAMARMAGFMNKVVGYFESVEQYYVPVMRGTADDLMRYVEAGLHATRRRPTVT